MNRGLLRTLGVTAALAFTLYLPAKAWSGSACCDESSTECKTGQNVGDKGSCSVSGEVCVQLASECPKPTKHPGVLCDCGKPDSSMVISPIGGLTFDKTFRKNHFTVSNGGNVPLHIDVMESGDTGAFAVKSPRKCKKKHSPTEPEDEGEYSLQSATATVKPQGCIRFPVKFRAHKRGVKSDQLDIKSDAIETPNEVFLDLFGAIGKP